MFANPRLHALRTLTALAVVGAALLHAAAPEVPSALAQSRPRCTDPRGVIEGTVFRADGQPAAGAQVQAVVAMSSLPGEAVLATAVADEGGRYRLDLLCFTEYRVKATLLTSAGALSGVYDKDGDGVPDGVALTEAVPAASGIDIVLGQTPVPPTAPPPLLPTRAPAPACTITDGEIRGMVLDGSGNPVAGAAIQFRGRTVAGINRPLTYSAADGTYVLSDLCEGTYYVVASKTLADGTTRSGMHPDPVELSPDSRTRTGIDIVLSAASSRATPTPADAPTAPPPTAVPGPSTTCRLVGSAAGTVALATGEGVGGATIQLVAQASAALAQPPLVVATSGPDGAWRAPRVCAGAYTVLAAKITAAQALVGVLDADGDARPDVVRIDASTPALSGLAITLRDVLAPAPNPFWRRGQAWPTLVDAR